jgi:hypothetical protein
MPHEEDRGQHDDAAEHRDAQPHALDEERHIDLRQVGANQRQRVQPDQGFPVS